VTGYAQCAEGLMREYDRGYTEVVFAHLAAQTGAAEAIIHKEFHLSSADPKLVGLENVRKIGRTSYDVADQLSNLGMEAIHPNAAKILRQADVPLRVKTRSSRRSRHLHRAVKAGPRAGSRWSRGWASMRSSCSSRIWWAPRAMTRPFWRR
jgi:aspartokinase